jgi:hypothetical protein
VLPVGVRLAVRRGEAPRVAWRSVDGYSHERVALLQRRIMAVEAGDLARSAASWLVAGAVSDVSIGGAST